MGNHLAPSGSLGEPLGSPWGALGEPSGKGGLKARKLSEKRLQSSSSFDHSVVCVRMRELECEGVCVFVCVYACTKKF